MALTRKEYTGNGSNRLYNINFSLGYLDKDYVHVYLADKDTNDQLDYTWRNNNQIELAEPVEEGVVFYIRRIIPRTDLVNDYEDGALLREKNLNASFLQALMILEEMQDGFITGDDVLYYTQDLDMQGMLNMNGNPIINLPYPATSTEPVRKSDILEIVDEELDDYRKGILELMNIQVQELPPFSGNTFQLNRKATNIQVEVDGRVLPPSFYAIAEDDVTVTMEISVNEDQIVVVRHTDLLGENTATSLVQQYDTVDLMVQNFGKQIGKVCVTSAFNKPVHSKWLKVDSGAGDLTDGTLALEGGSFAKLVIEPLMDVRAFGAYGDYNPVTMPATRVGDEYIGYAHDDSTAFNNAIRNCDSVVTHAEDSFAIAKHVSVSYDDKTCDFSKSKFYWFGKSDAAVGVGRDRAMFEIHGTFGEKIQESGVWEIWREGADTFPSDDTSILLENEFLLLAVGNIPSTPGETYMVRPSLADYRKTDVGTRFQTDYRLGWTHEQATFKYFTITPIKNTHLKLGYTEDMTDYDYDERDVINNRMSASATAMVYCYNCSVECYEADNWQYPVVMTYVTTDCKVSNIRLLPSQRESLSGIYGWGIAVQWNNALRPRSYNLAGQGNRRILDYTAAAYAYAENIGGESTRDGEMTTHGVYEHNLTYVNTRGFMSFANSGPDFGESTKDITVTHHHGSDIFAVTNVQNLSLKDVRVNSLRVNCVGLRMDNCTLYDSGRGTIDNLCQINNWSKLSGKPYEPSSAVITASTLSSNGLVYLVDDDTDENDTIIFENCDLLFREGDFAGKANVVVNGGTAGAKNGTGQLIRINNPTTVEFNNVKGYNIAFGVLSQIEPGFPPCNLTLRGGTYIGDNFESAFWANRDTGVSALGQSNQVIMDGVTIIWDFKTIMEDQLGQRNPWWYTKIVDCDIFGTGVVRLSNARSPTRFGNNTVHSQVVLDLDEGQASARPRIFYNTLVTSRF